MSAEYNLTDGQRKLKTHQNKYQELSTITGNTLSRRRAQTGLECRVDPVSGTADLAQSAKGL